MNSKNENFIPRERVDARLLARLLEESDETSYAASVSASAQPVIHCRTCRRTPQPHRQDYPECRTTDNSSSGVSLAMVYSPKQEFTDLYEPEEGLYRGTIFVQLDKPLQAGCCREGRWKA